MAGETKGELAEAIAKVALESALLLTGCDDTLYWQVSPDGAVIKPDFTIGTDSKSPTIIVLVNASGSAKESEKKYWRNVGEIFDSKARLGSQPSILNLVFESEIKPELIKLTEAICDATCIVDRDDDFGESISKWLNSSHTSAPSNRDERVELVARAITHGASEFDPELLGAMSLFAKKLSRLLFVKKVSLKPLWDLCRYDYQKRCGIEVRKSRVTMLRRGLGRWLVFEEPLRSKIFYSHLKTGKIKITEVSSYAVPLGMVKRSIGYLIIPQADDMASGMIDTTSRDLRLAADFFLVAAKGNPDSAAVALENSLLSAPEEMLKAADLLRKMPDQVSDWHKFCTKNWSKLTDPLLCYNLLKACYEDPSMGGAVPGSDESRVWLYDHLVSVLRSAKKANNNFGYSRLISEFKKANSDGKLKLIFDSVLSGLDARKRTTSTRWIERVLPVAKRPGERGFLEWLKGNKDIADATIAAFAFSLAALLREVSNVGGMDLSDLQDRHAYNLWNKLLTHQDFEPLPALVDAACGDIGV